MKPRTAVVGIVILAMLSIAIPLAAFVSRFWNSPISPDPTDWSNFGQYIGGVAGPIIGVINLAVLVYLALAVHRLETQREREFVRPFANLDSGDYEDNIYVKIQNVGLGPMVITKCECYSALEPTKKTADLVKLMPGLGGYPWKTFTIGGPPNVIPRDGESILIQLTPKGEEKEFAPLRTQVRRALRDIVVEVHYEDMFGNAMKPAVAALSGFSRHDA